jgi:sirohydrochlorin cobaltochelatase
LRQVDLLKNENHFAGVLPAFLEQSPFVGDVLQRVRTPNAIAVPFFISDGLHSRQDVPIAMGFAQKGRPWKNPVDVKQPAGLRLWYARAVGMDPRMTDVILERVGP